ncbi:MAG: peptidoglycan peptidase [Fibrobacteria bacterium]|nr:peptidoglycan peptidase [Fibrobacteria bacterium]
MRLPNRSMVLLVATVAGLVAVGAWARSRFLEPALAQNATHRIVERLRAEDRLREGDVLFQTSTSRQSKAIQLATKSPWSHCGILHRRDGNWMVLEAVQPVKSTPLEAWLARGKDHRFSIRRLQPEIRELDSSALLALRAEGARFVGRPYDLRFSWSDSAIYCSELVWKTFHRALGVDLGIVQTFADLDLGSSEARDLKDSRWGESPLPSDTLVTPAALHGAPQMETILEN